MATEREDLEATIADLERTLADAPPEMRGMLEEQLTTLRGLLPAVDRIAAAQEENRRHRPAIPPELVGFFRPEAPVVVPTWVPDEVTRRQVDEGMLRCPPGAAVYAQEDAVGCALPPPLGGIPVRHGLTLFFHPSGRLSAQRSYEHGLLRWNVSYHASGSRASQGYYADRAPHEQRQHGLHTSFSPGGAITSQSWYHDGALHGWSKHWEEDGSPIGATRYEHGAQAETILPDGQRRALRA
jgi:hypothetical protein